MALEGGDEGTSWSGEGFGQEANFTRLQRSGAIGLVGKAMMTGGRPRCPVFTIHNAVVGRLGAEQKTLALTIGARSIEPRAPGHSTFEMVNVRRFRVRSCRLVVATVLVQPRNRERNGWTVRIDIGGASNAFRRGVPAWREQGASGCACGQKSAT
jgi:hypothetical protein